MLGDAGVKELLKNAASNESTAAYLIETIRNVYTDLPDEPDIFRIVTSPEYWKEQKEKGDKNA